MTFHFLAFERHSISLHLKAPDCEKIDILNAFFLSEFFQYNDDFYGDFYGDLYGDFYGDFYGDPFVATNFLISLFPLYDFNFILLASERASQRASLEKGPVTPGYAPVFLISFRHSTRKLIFSGFNLGIVFTFLPSSITNKWLIIKCLKFFALL